MKITVEFDSLEEFQEHFTISDSANADALGELHEKLNTLGAKMDGHTKTLSEAVDKVYHAGRDDVGGNFHKDIKDIDDVAEDYDIELYTRVKMKFDELFNKYPERDTIIKQHIKDVVGDYEVRPGLSVNAYEQLEHKADWFEQMMI